MAAKIGDRGRAACPLYPSGRVLIDRAPMAARAETGPIEEGTEIVVVGGDRFSLVVRAFDPSDSASLPNFGEPILTAKEAAAFQAELTEETRRQQEEDHRQMFHKLLKFGAVAGVIIGVGLVVLQTYRRGYTDDLVWIPFLSSACWFCIVFLAFFLGAATENILMFISIPCAPGWFSSGDALLGTVHGHRFVFHDRDHGDNALSLDRGNATSDYVKSQVRLARLLLVF